jgi:excisionase family DNA binding protein
MEEKNVDLVAEGLMTVNEAAEFLGLSRSRVYGLMESGELRFAKIGKSRRIPRRAVTAFAASRMVGAVPGTDHVHRDQGS